MYFKYILIYFFSCGTKNEITMCDEWGGAESRGNGGGQEAEEHRAVHQRGPVPSHGTASEPLSWLRTERQCVREPDQDYFFFSPLSLLCHSSSFHLLFSRLVCPYPQVRRGRPDGLPPGEGGGGSRAQSREYPPACEGRWGYVTSGAGPRPVE